MAKIAEPLRATLRMLTKPTRERTINADDIKAVLVAGATEQQIEGGPAICFAFNVIARLADAFGILVPDQKAFEAGAKYRLARGYR